MLLRKKGANITKFFSRENTARRKVKTISCPPVIKCQCSGEGRRPAKKEGGRRRGRGKCIMRPWGVDISFINFLGVGFFLKNRVGFDVF